jgi:hypothetical protein
MEGSLGCSLKGGSSRGRNLLLDDGIDGGKIKASLGE